MNKEEKYIKNQIMSKYTEDQLKDIIKEQIKKRPEILEIEEDDYRVVSGQKGYIGFIDKSNWDITDIKFKGYEEWEYRIPSPRDSYFIKFKLTLEQTVEVGRDTIALGWHSHDVDVVCNMGELYMVFDKETLEFNEINDFEKYYIIKKKK